MSTLASQPFGKNIKTLVEGRSGRDISFLSEYNLETEVLYPPGTKFEVMNRVEQNGKVSLHYKEQ